MKKYLILIISVLLLITATVFLYIRNNKPNSKDNSYTVVEVQKKEITSEVSVTGVLEPRIKITLTSSKKGQVEEIYVDEGSIVRAGQTLAMVSSDDRINLLTTAKKNLEIAQASNNTTDVKKAQNELRIAEAAYQKIPIISPIAGLVTLRNVEPGQKVETNTTILEVSDELVAKVLMDETDIGKIKEGMKAKIVVDAYPDDEVEGKIIKIAYTATVESNVTAYEVLIKLTSKALNLLKSGMSVDVNVVTYVKKNAIQLPAAAVRTSNNSKYVFLLNQDGKSYSKEVTTGVEDEEGIEILSGIEKGDRVAIITQDKTNSSTSVTSKKTDKQKEVEGPPPMMMGGRPR
ncbi:MAG: efflux RND transporter periplasmic adaptor subunit [Elusimicrobiota bacterium]